MYVGPAHDPMSCLRTHLNSPDCYSSSGHGVRPTDGIRLRGLSASPVTLLSSVFLPQGGQMTVSLFRRKTGCRVVSFVGKPSRVHRWGKKSTSLLQSPLLILSLGAVSSDKIQIWPPSWKTLPANLMGENCGWDFLKVKGTYRCLLQWTPGFLVDALLTSLSFLLVIFQYHFMLWRVLGTNSRYVERYYLRVASKCWNGDWSKASRKETQNKCIIDRINIGSKALKLSLVSQKPFQIL